MLVAFMALWSVVSMGVRCPHLPNCCSIKYNTPHKNCLHFPPSDSNIPDYLKITDAMGAALIYLTIDIFIDIYAARDGHLLHLVSSVPPLLLTAITSKCGTPRFAWGDLRSVLKPSAPWAPRPCFPGDSKPWVKSANMKHLSYVSYFLTCMELS